MDSTQSVEVTCDACPFHHGCPVFTSGRRACVLGMWPLTAMVTTLAALAGVGHLVLGV